MSIVDEELILFHYRDGLPPTRMAQIAEALRSSPELRDRHAQLVALLSAASALPAHEPDAGFEQRQWQRLAGRLSAAVPTTPAARFPRRTVAAAWRPRRRLAGVAVAASAVLALVFVAGRWSAPMHDPVAPAPPMAATAPAAGLAGDRVLAAYVAAHLRQTEGLLLTSLNGDGAISSDAGLALTLVESNRLYAAAAEHAGNAALADFLRQMEPVLIELANPPRSEGIEVREGLRDYLRESDLLFKVRAAEARLAPRGERRA